MHDRRHHPDATPAHAFTLLELLVVIAVFTVLISLLVSSLSSARAGSKSIYCRSNLRAVMQAIIQYSSENNDYIVPSYNMKGVQVGVLNPLDGWAPILDRDGYLPGNRTLATDNPFVCPNTLNVAGMASTQTGTNPDNPKGYMEWPAILTLTQDYGTTIPLRGFTKIIRVGYWINGDNPIGIPKDVYQGVNFTGSVGYGPGTNGVSLQHYSLSDIRSPSQLIAMADGLYAGHQELTRLGDKDLRIGYRHPGRVGQANTAFADGHVEPIEGDAFPREYNGAITLEQAMQENMGTGPTVYADPFRYLPGVAPQP